MYCFVVPLSLDGFYEFNLNVMKEMKITEAFLGLDMELQNCELETSYDNCTTLSILERLKEKCDCLPFTLRRDGEPLCKTNAQIECARKIFADNSCLQNCEGLLVNSFTRTDTWSLDFTTLFPKVIEDYENFKGKYDGYEWSESSLILQPLTESPRTEQQSLWTCCQLLEEPWDY